jgi:hypothetical protein
MLPGSRAEDIFSLYWSLVNETSEISPDEKVNGDLGRVSEQARKKNHSAQSTAQEKQRSGILVRTC